MFKDSKIFVAGHTGLLGSALIKKLNEHGHKHIITRSHAELELTNKDAVFDFFSTERPEYVFLAAGKVGGIISNKTYPADYFHINISIQDAVFEAAEEYGVKQLIFYGSSCIYPKFSTQPIKEQYLLAAPIEETSEAYATAKIAGIIACKAYNQQYQTNRFIALVPNSIYGSGDNFDLENSHVLSALIRKFHEAKINNRQSVTLWGSGKVRREFIYSEDVAEASLFVIQHVNQLENKHYNVGTGQDYSIEELAASVAKIIGYEGKVLWDTSKPDGAPRKLLDSSRLLSLGWKPVVGLEDGLSRAYRWYQNRSNTISQESEIFEDSHAK
jgi:GDP-L-fucose synthase